VKRLVLTSSSPGGSVFPSSFVLIEPRHLRQDRSRPGDIYAVPNGMHRKDTVMDIVIVSALKQSCLLQSIKGSDYAIRKVESVKFRADARSTGPIQSSSTRRQVPLALNHLGLRGGHFSAFLKEFATILVTRPGGCALLQGPLHSLHQRRAPQDLEHMGLPPHLDCPEGTCGPNRGIYGCLLR
jgi:hypothetical protein